MEADERDAKSEVVKLAILYENGILAGYTDPAERAQATEDKTHVIVPSDCDLTPGRYRYMNGAFYPLMPRARKRRNGPHDVDVQTALVNAVRAMRDGQPVPIEASHVLEEYIALFGGRE